MHGVVPNREELRGGQVIQEIQMILKLTIRLFEYKQKFEFMEDKLGKSLQCSVNNLAGEGKYQVCEPIKRGADGYVYRIQFRNKSKQQAALKAIPKFDVEWDFNTPNAEQQFKKLKPNHQRVKKAKNQMKIHQSLKTQYVARLRQKFEDQLYFYLIMDYFPKGDLTNFIKKKKLSTQQLRDIGLQIAKGIATLHNENIAHRDIKPQNILLDDKNKIKICDFGCAIKFQNQKLKGTVGTLEYMAPEIIKSYDERVDIWSFGILLYFMATGRVPFKLEKQQLKELALKVNAASIEKLTMPSQLGYSFENLIRRILMIDPQERITMSEIIKHPFFRGETMKAPSPPKLIRRQRIAQSQQTLKRAIDMMHPLTANKENQDLFNKKDSSMRKSTHHVPSVNESMELRKSLLEEKLKKSDIPFDKMLLKKKLQHQVRRPSKESVCLQGMDCKGLKYKKTIRKEQKTYEIQIDQKGYRKKYLYSGNCLEINPQGKVIRVSQGNTTKQYLLNNLPQKYHKVYNNYRSEVKMLKEQKKKKKKTHIKLSEHNWVEYHQGRAQFNIDGKTFNINSLGDLQTVDTTYRDYVKEYYGWLLKMPEVCI